MTVFKKFRPLCCAVAAMLLLSVAPLSVYAAPTPQKSTATKKKNTSAKKPAASNAAKKSTTKKSTAATSSKKSTKKSSTKKSSAKKSSTKKSKSKQSSTKKQRSTRKNARQSNNRPSRQSTVMGAKPATVQADTYHDTDSAAERKKADDLLMSAMGLLGVSYRFGGSNPASGLDCSGFIQYIFREAMNVNLPRTSAAMAEVGVAVEKNSLKPGDLVFFARGGKRIGHVGMYIGNGKFIHSPRTGKSIEIQELNKVYYVKNYAGARRVPNANRAARFVQ